MIERQAEFFVSVRFRVVLVDPARKAGADEFGVLEDGRPIRMMFNLGVDKGHPLRAGNPFVSEWHETYWSPQAHSVAF